MVPFVSAVKNGADDNILGRPLNSLYGYVASGLFQNEAEVDRAAYQVGAAPGRIRYKDISGPDGKPDKKIDAYDRTWIGVQNPDLSFGITMRLTWKNFDFKVFLNSELGSDLNVSGWKSWTDFYFLGTVGENYGTRLLDAWTPANRNSTIPAVSVNNLNDEGRFSSYFVESGSYIKIRHAELGYNFSEKLLGAADIRRLRVYIRCDHIATIAKRWDKDAYTGLDPETPGTTYPLPFSFTTGLNLEF